ncbi:MAG: hypothetical protein A3G81_13950 [Betaproteobacteria bacterium RIFCSPLOWO2_12_FULL_65_14]|nr:MAG: hypothetical protein A3G81_13950 [Betaproteobacteria bacterium RIFCSPLOWO2_12_FULL_65_14]
MTFQEEVAALQARIAKAESERDTWRTSGIQENYLAAYSRVDALELQLERLRQEGLRSSARNREPAAVCALLQSAPRASAAAAVADAAGERARLMAELFIAYNGRQYQYGSYRYDHFEDAVNYARLQGSELPASTGPAPMPPAPFLEVPDESQRRLMAAFAITFQDGVYHLGAYRYDRLADAVTYASAQGA